MQETSGTEGIIIGLYAGTPEELWPGRPPSAIRKSAVIGPVKVDKCGFTQDRQADLNVHGGEEKAIHHYPSEHMVFWQKMFPGDARRFVSGCFGENISTTGLTEHNLCLGDILTLGSALVQVCQGRQPCWKLNAHLENKQMAAQFQRTLKTGWYYRVLEEGTVTTADTMRLVDRPNPDWPLFKVSQARFSKLLDTRSAHELVSLPELSESWRAALVKKQAGLIENTSLRLEGS